MEQGVPAVSENSEKSNVPVWTEFAVRPLTRLAKNNPCNNPCNKHCISLHFRDILPHFGTISEMHKKTLKAFTFRVLKELRRPDLNRRPPGYETDDNSLKIGLKNLPVQLPVQ
jgi:hypothetical protein